MNKDCSSTIVLEAWAYAGVYPELAHPGRAERAGVEGMAIPHRGTGGTRVTTLYDDGSTQTLTRYYTSTRLSAGFGGAYEVTGSSVRKYYAIPVGGSLAGQTVAMRDADGLKYFLTDHLGSTLAVLDDQGAVLQQQRYPSTGSGQACHSANRVNYPTTQLSH